jgi:hypothetical protein
MAKRLIPVGFIGGLLVALGLLAGSPSTLADAATVQVAIDVDVAGNEDNVLGPTESCNEAALQVGETIDVDVVVRGVPEYANALRSGGIAGFAFNLLFDPDVVRVDRVHTFNGPTILDAISSSVTLTIVDYDYALLAGRQLPPGTTGNVEVTMLDGAGQYESGDGVMTRVTLTAVGAGTARLGLRLDYRNWPKPEIFSGDTTEYVVESTDAALVVGAGSCLATPPPFPTPTPRVTFGPTPSPFPGAYTIWLEPDSIPLNQEATVFVKASAEGPHAAIGSYSIEVSLTGAQYVGCESDSSCQLLGDRVDVYRSSSEWLIGEVTLAAITLRADRMAVIAAMGEYPTLLDPNGKGLPVTFGNRFVTTVGVTPPPTPSPTRSATATPTQTPAITSTLTPTASPPSTGSETPTPTTVMTPVDFPRGGGRTSYASSDAAISATSMGILALSVGFWLARRKVT